MQDHKNLMIEAWDPGNTLIVGNVCDEPQRAIIVVKFNYWERGAK